MKLLLPTVLIILAFACSPQGDGGKKDMLAYYKHEIKLLEERVGVLEFQYKDLSQKLTMCGVNGVPLDEVPKKVASQAEMKRAYITSPTMASDAVASKDAFFIVMGDEVAKFVELHEKYLMMPDNKVFQSWLKLGYFSFTNDKVGMKIDISEIKKSGGRIEGVVKFVGGGQTLKYKVYYDNRDKVFRALERGVTVSIYHLPNKPKNCIQIHMKESRSIIGGVWR